MPQDYRSEDGMNCFFGIDINTLAFIIFGAGVAFGIIGFVWAFIAQLHDNGGYMP